MQLHLTYLEQPGQYQYIQQNQSLILLEVKTTTDSIHSFYLLRTCPYHHHHHHSAAHLQTCQYHQVIVLSESALRPPICTFHADHGDAM